jgi:hypothetical protein
MDSAVTCRGASPSYKTRPEAAVVPFGVRMNADEMLQRPRKAENAATDGAFGTRVHECRAEIERRATQETNVDELDETG